MKARFLSRAYMQRFSLFSLHWLIAVAGLLTVKNKKLTHRVVNHYRCENIGDKGVGSEKPEAFDENAHQHGAKEGTYTRDCIKEKNLDNDRVFPALKYKKNVGDIGHHVGNEKGAKVADHRVASSGGVVDFFNGQVKEPNRMIFFLQGGENLPGYEMKDGYMGNGGKTTSQGIFDKLNNGRIINIHGVYSIL